MFHPKIEENETKKFDNDNKQDNSSVSDDKQDIESYNSIEDDNNDHSEFTFDSTDQKGILIDDDEDVFENPESQINKNSFFLDDFDFGGGPPSNNFDNSGGLLFNNNIGKFAKNDEERLTSIKHDDGVG